MATKQMCACALGCLTAIIAIPLSAQTTTTTNCAVYPGSVNCTSSTRADPMVQFQQSMAQLGAALAQRRVAQAAEQARWNAAATAQAREAAKLARANYDATTAALSRFSQDSVLSKEAPVNGGMGFDWSLLNYESRYETTPSGYEASELLRVGWIDTPDGGKVLRRESTMRYRWEGQALVDKTASLRFSPSAGFMSAVWESQPLMTTQSPAYSTTVVAGSHAFATRMEGQGYDVTVPPGIIDIDMLPLAVAAIPGELPQTFRIWILDDRGETVPADFKVIGYTTLKEPVGPADGSCANGKVRTEKRDAIKLRLSGGVPFETWEVLAKAPHLSAPPSLRCRIMR